MSRYIKIVFRNGKARSIPINFAMCKAIKIVDCLNHYKIAEAIITDKDYENKENK